MGPYRRNPSTDLRSGSEIARACPRVAPRQWRRPRVEGFGRGSRRGYARAVDLRLGSVAARSRRSQMSVAELIALAVAIGLFVYLVYALIRGERL